MTTNHSRRPEQPAPPILLPADHPRGPGEPNCTAVRHDLLPPEAAGALAAAGEPGTVLTAAFGALLHRLTGQSELALPVDRPGAGPDGVWLSFHGDPSLRELAGEPADGRAPVTGPAAVRVQLDAPVDVPAELRFVLGPAAEAGRPLELHYDERRFTAATADRLLRHYRTLLADALARPDAPVSELRLLTDAELHTVLVAWNATGAEFGHRDCLHHEFEARTAEAPDAPALLRGREELTYRQVNAAANRLAHHLRGLGVGPDTRVGICLDRSPELLTAALAVLKAGGAYVPLDPDYPAARLAGMIAGADCAVLLSRSDLTANLPAPGPGGPHRLLLDRAPQTLAEHPDHDPEGGAGPEDLCYVIYTSGSTGVPKPIALRHRGVLNNLADLNSRFAVGPQDRVLALSSPSFDMSVYEFLGITAAGGTVVLPDPGRAKEPAHWAELLAAHRVTVWNSAPALLELLTEYLERSGAAPLPLLRLAMLGGDWIPVALPDRIRALAPALRFIALGGATESSIHSTIFEVETTDPAWTSIPYGRPMANQRTYILDGSGRPVPPGVPGELHLAGTGLARGYLDQPERTAERFLDWSYGEVRDERLYRTGDIARYGADGLIELLGRADFQVKINGLRIELGEIEAALRALPAVKEAAVVPKPDQAGRPRLVGYVVPHPGQRPAGPELRAQLARTLPDFLVPSTVAVLDAMPLSPNGKVDRKALPAPAEPAPAAGGEHPVGPWEERIAEVWTELLGARDVRRDDDFFGLGGDSLRALRSLALIDPALRWPDLFRHRTVRALAEHLSTTVGETPAAGR